MSPWSVPCELHQHICTAMITLRPACADDYVFAFGLYVEAIKPLATAWTEWVYEDQQAQFASLWRPDDTRIIVLDDEDIGWVEFRRTGDEVFLKQLYISSRHQGRGIGSFVMRRLLEVQHATASGRKARDGEVDGAVRVEEQSSLPLLRAAWILDCERDRVQVCDAS